MYIKHKWLVTDDDSQGIVVLVHGTGEHYGRYQHVGEYLNRCGWDVYTGDLPGWGRTSGRKGHIDSFAQYTDTVRAWVEEALEDAAERRPVFLLGHSLGGLVAVRFITAYERRGELAGMILSSPCLQLKLQVPAWKTQLARLLDTIWPTLSMANGITPEMVSRDPEVQRAYVSDPYNVPKVSVRWFQELHRAMDEAWKQRKKLDIPLLVLQAGDDSLIESAAVERFATGLPHCTFHLFPGLRHELLNEPEKNEVMQRIEGWMTAKKNH
ncbi:lysophospholipase [Brevibacillus sp. TJ4]|uniref:alpha/beta hydrolase n=1 Tax=Brevibacillus sp. TJ4 TaxID=3234853 RepID=UPI0037D1BFAE